ncbi:MAG: lactonase family protein, partial [Clostridia bacterium]|nr:lactonase family protein [Clostridia bacterium]
TDAVYFYPLDNEGVRKPAQRVPMQSGAGPRHAVFGPNACWYVLCELSCNLLVYRGYGRKAKLLHTISVLRGERGASTGAALRLSPDRKRLLATVRGANTLAIWEVSPSGMLSGMRQFDAHGACPRGAAFTPDGNHVLCACEQNDRITAFSAKNGALAFLGAAEVPKPTCVCFQPEP